MKISVRPWQIAEFKDVKGTLMSSLDHHELIVAKYLLKKQCQVKQLIYCLFVKHKLFNSTRDLTKSFFTHMFMIS